MICAVNGCEKDTEFDIDFWCKEHAKIYDRTDWRKK